MKKFVPVLFFIVLFLLISGAYKIVFEAFSFFLGGSFMSVFSFVFIIILILALLLGLSCIVITKQKTVKIIEQFGKYVATKEAGLSFKLPSPIQKVAHTLDLNLIELKEKLKLKTKDNLFIEYPVTLQIKVIHPFKACYELENPRSQILSYVGNFIRSEVGKHEFMAIYGIRDELENEVLEHLGDKIKSFGWEIVAVLVDEPNPSAEVRRSYDAVNESLRNLEAAKNNAEANKIKLVKDAEAQKEAKRLYGEGIASQREAIAQGFSQSVYKISQSMEVSPELAAAFLVQMTKFDTIRDSSEKGHFIISDVKSNFEFENTINLKNFIENYDKERK